MAFQQKQRAKNYKAKDNKKIMQEVNLEESSVEKLEEQEQKKQARKRKRQAKGDISKGPSTKKTRLEVENQSSSLVDQEISHSQQSSESEDILTRKEETILKSSKVSKKATQRKHKPRAMKDVSNEKQPKKKVLKKGKELLKQRYSLKELSAKEKKAQLSSKVKEQYSLLSTHVSGRTMNDVQYLTHCTNEKRRGMIESTGKLLAKSSQYPHKCPLAVGQKIKGVWLTATTSRSGKPFQASPYGTERINIPVSALLSSETISRWSLFFESTYYSQNHIQYVRFVLLDTQTAEEEQETWCKDYLLKVDIEQNPFVYWNGEQFSSISNHNRKHADIYVEILKVGEIETPCGENWDQVKETRRRKNTHALVYLSLCPLLRSEGDRSVGTAE